MNDSVIGLDIAKNVFHVFTVSAKGKGVKKKLKRAELLTFFANYPKSVIGLEACGGAHHWARELNRLGHKAILLHARYVKGFVIGNKNDFNDAQAIFDAVSRPTKRVIAIKSIAQQDLQMLHKIREDLVKHRTALVNQLLGLLSERGLVIAQDINQARKQLPLILEDAKNGLTALIRELLAERIEQLRQLDASIKDQDQRITRLSQQHPLSRRLLAVPGIGPVTATIVAADLGDSVADITILEICLAINEESIYGL